ncbi:MAG: TonB family protein [Myxococcota bacterium]|nr:TonB family protein [Myxococcota bacterium]
MFDHLGQPAPRNRKRQAGAAMLSVLALLALGSASLMSGSQLVEHIPVQAVQVDFDELADLPAPPPPPPKLGVEDGSEAPDTVSPTAPDPVAPTPEPDPAPADEDTLTPTPAPAMAALDTPPKGTPDGTLMGDPDGEAGGVFGGTKGGVTNGVLCGSGQDCTAAPTAVHASQLTPTRQVAPQYPASARELGLEGDCSVRMFVDERGRVTQVRVERCPVAFQDAAVKAASQWRFRPYKDVDGTRKAATFVLTLRFTLQD